MTEEQVPFAGNIKVPSDDCEEAFFAVYPDFFYEGSTALIFGLKPGKQPLIM